MEKTDVEEMKPNFEFTFVFFNPVALRKAKIVYNFGLSECNRVKPSVGHRIC